MRFRAWKPPPFLKANCLVLGALEGQGGGSSNIFWNFQPKNGGMIQFHGNADFFKWVGETPPTRGNFYRGPTARFSRRSGWRLGWWEKLGCFDG